MRREFTLCDLVCFLMNGSCHAGVYRPRHPERTVLYRVLFHHFDRFLAEYESRFEKEYGFLRSIIKEVAEGHHEA